MRLITKRPIDRDESERVTLNPETPFDPVGSGTGYETICTRIEQDDHGDMVCQNSGGDVGTFQREELVEIVDGGNYKR